METRVAVISIIVENNETVEKLNALLHDFGQIIIGRMGIPYRPRGINMSGKIGALPGVSAKTAYSNVIGNV